MPRPSTYEAVLWGIMMSMLQTVYGQSANNGTNPDSGKKKKDDNMAVFIFLVVAVILCSCACWGSGRRRERMLEEKEETEETGTRRHSSPSVRVEEIKKGETTTSKKDSSEEKRDQQPIVEEPDDDTGSIGADDPENPKGFQESDSESKIVAPCAFFHEEEPRKKLRQPDGHLRKAPSLVDLEGRPTNGYKSSRP